jgi:hypothetical protein
VYLGNRQSDLYWCGNFEMVENFGKCLVGFVCNNCPAATLNGYNFVETSRLNFTIQQTSQHQPYVRHSREIFF